MVATMTANHLPSKDTLDEIIRRIHFSSATLDELTTKELYEDPQEDCELVISQAKAALEAYVASEVRAEQQIILAFAERIQANGEFVPIQNGILPWLKERLTNPNGGK